MKDALFHISVEFMRQVCVVYCAMEGDFRIRKV